MLLLLLACTSKTPADTSSDTVTTTETDETETGTTTTDDTETGSTETGTTTTETGEPTDSATTDESVFFDDFDGTTLSDDWKVAYRNWGGKADDGTDYNGGVHPDNVTLPGDGTLVLTTHGDRYDGLPLGTNKDGSTRADGKRVGAAIATDAYIASGRYEVRMKAAPVDGVSSAIWTFHYVELYPGDADYPEGDTGYYAINHEIDIELPGRPGVAHEDISLSWALLNTWIGEQAGEYTVGFTDLGAPQDDGEWHTYRFDWHTDPPGVDFYLDDVFLRTIDTTVPSRASRFWLGAWFPKNWAGDPDFDTSAVIVDWVRITPFFESGDEVVPESYPDHGWAE